MAHSAEQAGNQANDRTTERALLVRLFNAAVTAAHPDSCLPGHIPAPAPGGRTVIVGAGKAAAAMAATLEREWPADAPHQPEGLVITRYGLAVPTRWIEVVEAGHPVPDAAGLSATARILEMVSDLGPQDRVICLLSGGGSALLTQPAPGITLADKQVVTQGLLASGAPIHHMNTVRKHLSAVKGGGLARHAAPAPVTTLAISDIVGDDPAIIASAPTLVDDTTPADALALLQHYGIRMPDAVSRLLTAPPAAPEPIPSGDYVIAGRPASCLASAAALARQAGLSVINLGDAVEGEARDIGRQHAKMACDLLDNDPQAATGNGTLILSGGELTVTLGPDGDPDGLGGPNREYALAFASAIKGRTGISLLAADTDGQDGMGDGAGAFADGSTWSRATAAGLDPDQALRGHDSHRLFAGLGDLFAPGPTHTNVNDFRAIIVRPAMIDGQEP